MKNFFVELFQAPDGVKADEIAVLAVCVGVLFMVTITIYIGLELYDVVVRHHIWDPVGFSNSAAVLFGSAGTVLAAIAVAMGVKAKFGG